MLKRFWFKFAPLSPPDALNLGCGVTAYGEDDARNIVRESVFGQFSPRRIDSVIEDIDVSTLDAGHVRPNMGDPSAYGVWFPLGVDLRRRARGGSAKDDNAPDFFASAFDAAQEAARADEVPVGAAIVCAGAVIAVAGNRTLRDRDPTAHAETLAIREAARQLGSERLVDCDLYVTLEPCAMCAAAISFARIRRLYFAASDPKGGAVEHGPRFFSQPTCHHAPEVYGGIRESEAAQLLRNFFQARR